jgi:putative protease
MEQKIGRITHYFGKIGVAVIELTDGSLAVGDNIRVRGGDREFDQAVSSMQIEHQEVSRAEVGQSLGLKVESPAKEGDEVFKLAE